MIILRYKFTHDISNIIVGRHLPSVSEVQIRPAAVNLWVLF